MQVPSKQTSPDRHAWPHAPQFNGLSQGSLPPVLKSTHFPLQFVCRGEHPFLHAPSMQLSPAPQAQ
jgi:hypothetical protein